MEITRQILRRGDRVIAACRVPSAAAELQQLLPDNEKRLHVLELDVLHERSIESAASAAHDLTDAIDTLFNVAGTKGNVPGVVPEKNLSRFFGQIESKSMTEVFATNTVGPLLIVQAMTPLLDDSTVVNISSSMGSNGLMNRGDWYAYRASKAALNAVSRALSFDLRERGTIVIAMHPGWVKTDMGTDEAPYPLTENTASMLGIIDGLTQDDSGKYFNWKGDELPW